MSAKPGIGEHRPCSARRFLIVTAMLSCAVISPLATASVYFIAPWGTPFGDGTSDQPLDLATTLSSRSSAKPGDTLILLGGTYHGAFVSTLTGAENNPIIVRQAPGARATIDGDLTVQGAWTTYWGLEVTKLYHLRQWLAGLRPRQRTWTRDLHPKRNRDKTHCGQHHLQRVWLGDSCLHRGGRTPGIPSGGEHCVQQRLSYAPEPPLRQYPGRRSSTRKPYRTGR